VTRTLKERFDPRIPASFLETPPAPRLSENALWLLAQRYFVLRHDDRTDGLRREASFEEFARRVARTVAAAESLYLPEGEGGEWLRTLEKNIAADMLERRFLFNSPCLFSSAAGLTVRPEEARRLYQSPDEMGPGDYRHLLDVRTKNQQLFACFVLDIPDSIEGIFDSVRDASIISKFGGGVGGNFGHLREKGSEINGGIGGKASGPVSFMETWNTMGAVVVQGGKRRAALMGMLFDDHPDIEEFIDSKTEEGKFSYFNISVAVSDALMRSVETDGEFPLRSRPSGRTVRTLRGRALLDRICESAWKRGDPGVFFIDRAQEDNLLKLDPDWRIESTNPCGEQPLPNYTSCNLGSINVEAFVREGAFDWRAFEDQVFRSVYYLDLVIDACSYPLERIEERTKRIRPVGLGIMGLADAALLLGLRYGDAPFRAFCERLGGVLASAALQATAELVSQGGKAPFPESPLVSRLFERFRSEVEEQGAAEESSGPSRGLFPKGVLFGEDWFDSLSEEEYDRLVERMRRSRTLPFTLVNTLAEFRLPDRGRSFEEARATLRALVRGELRNSRRLSIAPTGSISMILDTSSGIEPNFAWSWTRHFAKVDGSGTEPREFWHRLLPAEQREEVRRNGHPSDPVYVTAYEISTEAHVEVTGIFARVVDSGISKTVNLPASASVEDVRRVYEACYRLGCKGITIYRDGSRSYQPIEITKAPEKPAAGRMKERPGLVVFGKTIKENTPWGSIYVTLNFDREEPFEVFVTIGKSGSELKAMTEALSRTISIALRSGSKLEDVIATLRGLSGKEYWMFGFDESHVARSIPDAIAVLLEKLLERKEPLPDAAHQGGAPCPECGSPMEMISGCAYCFSCGYSPCK
jgi:ribonucleoside-diphosphate reductase alpha chain